MQVTVDGKAFKKAVLNSMYRNPATINFYKDGNRLLLQTSGEIMSNILVPIDSSDNDEFDISAIVGNTVKLLNTKEEVRLELRGEILQIIQSHFSYGTTQSFECRVPTKAFDIVYDVPYQVNMIREFVTATKALDELARVLAVDKVPITIFNKKAYMKYSNAGLVMDLDLPNMSITAESLRKVVSALDRSKERNCHFDAESKVIYFKIADNESVAITVADEDRNTVEVLDTLIAETEFVANINISDYLESMYTICSSYKRIELEFSVCEDGIRMFINQTPTQVVVGSSDNALCTIKISTAQLLAISKLFGEYGLVEVRRSENKLCLRQKNLNKTFIMSGMIY